MHWNHIQKNCAPPNQNRENKQRRQFECEISNFFRQSNYN